MTKQLLIYQDIIPISSEAHKEWCLKATGNFSFAKDINAFPVLAAEFFQAGLLYPLVFVKADDAVYPSAIVGVREEENLFVAESGEWQGDYIPAFVRRYPFVFSLSDDKQQFTVCIDQSFEGWNQSGSGERIFDSEGNQTQYLKNIVTFLQDYQNNFLGTEAFCKQLVELDLLEDMQANWSLDGAEQPPLKGFLGVSREKLKGLSQEVIYDLMQSGALELIHVHLLSLNLFSTLAKKTKAKDEAKAES